MEPSHSTRATTVSVSSWWRGAFMGSTGCSEWAPPSPYVTIPLILLLLLLPQATNVFGTSGFSRYGPVRSVYWPRPSDQPSEPSLACFLFSALRQEY